MKMLSRFSVEPRLLMSVLVVSLFIIGAGNTTQAEAREADIGITLSNTCLIMLKNDFETNCPSYDELGLLFPDTSNQNVSGILEYTDNFYQRSPAAFKNHYEYYKFDDKIMLWIDPPIDLYEKINIITITSENFIYPVRDQVINSSSIKIGQGRYIDSCRNVIITSENFYFLLGDTIQHLLLNCEEGTTNFNEEKIIEWERTKHDITTSAKYKLEKWIDYVKENCLGVFQQCKGPQNIIVQLSDTLTIKDSFD